MRPAQFRTPIIDLLGIRHPILAGGLMWLSDHNFVSAVARAGGMGFMTPRSYSSLNLYRDGIRRAKDLSEGSPFGVNLYISSRPAENEAVMKMAEIMIEEGITCAETAGGSPIDVLKLLKPAGVTVIHKATTIRHALNAERSGADAIILVGAECGGHPGMAGLTSLVLAARGAEALSVPLVIGGGVGTGAQMSGLLAMGADAILLGSRLLTADEIWAHDAYKDYLVSLDETSTTLVMQSVKNPYRCLINDTAAKVVDLEQASPGDYEPLRPYTLGSFCREAYETGDWNRGILSLGPSIAFSRKRESIEAIFDTIVDEARSSLDRLSGMTALETPAPARILPAA